MAVLPINNILFLDIETVPQYASHADMPDEWKGLWALKAQYLVRNREEETVETIYQRAGIYAEFGKIICISCGFISGHGEEKKMSIKSFSDEDEKKILLDFCAMLKKWTTEGQKFLCAHNGREFDFPYICRRLIIHGLPLPGILDIAGKKPWEINHLDTMDLWKFGDFKNYTSLNLLAHALQIPTPKDDIDGSMVWDVYRSGSTPAEIAFNKNRIITYCQKDVVTVAQILLRMHAETPIREENIELRN